MLLRIHHAAIICSDYPTSKRFYTETLGLAVLAEHFRAQRIGAFTHALGVAVVLLALAWGAALLRLQRRRIAGTVLVER